MSNFLQNVSLMLVTRGLRLTAMLSGIILMLKSHIRFGLSEIRVTASYTVLWTKQFSSLT
jgi:hypothetical protein